jgi:hypothetical protein
MSQKSGYVSKPLREFDEAVFFFVKEKAAKNILITCTNGSEQPHAVLASCSRATYDSRL